MPQRAGSSFAARRCRLASPPRPMPGISLTKNEAATHPKGTSGFSHSPLVAVWSLPSAQLPSGTQTSFRSVAAGVFPPRLRREAGMSGDGRGEEEPFAGEARAALTPADWRAKGHGALHFRQATQACQPHPKLKFFREAKGPNRHFYLGSRWFLTLLMPVSYFENHLRFS